MVCSLPVLSTALVYFSNMQDSQMNRKLWGIALLGTWKGFPSAKAACCVNGRNYKGIRRECSSAADGKGQSRAGKCSGVGLCGHLWKLLGWAQGSLGHAELEGGSQSPWLCTVFSGPSGAHPRAGQISLCSSCTKGQ